MNTDSMDLRAAARTLALVVISYLAITVIGADITGSSVVVSAADASGHELWRSDGTIARAFRVTDV